MVLALIAIGALAVVPALLVLTEQMDRIARRRTMKAVADGALTPGAAEEVVAEEAQAVLDAHWDQAQGL